MTFSFHPEAEEEFSAAIEYYIEVFTAIQNITIHPDAWPVVEDDIHSCLVNRFPFGILYSTEPSGVFVIAVMHQRRRPGYWKNRH
jgi:hypothetical protein